METLTLASVTALTAHFKLSEARDGDLCVMSHPRMEPRAPWCSQPHLGAVSALSQWQVCLTLCSITPPFPHVLQHLRLLTRVSTPIVA